MAHEEVPDWKGTIENLEKRLEVELIEREHRSAQVLLNLYRYGRSEEGSRRKTAAWKAFVWWLVRPSRLAGAGVAAGTLVAVLTLLEIRNQGRLDRAFRAQGRMAELADRMMEKRTCARPTFCNVDGVIHCGFKNELAVRRSAANEYLWLMHNFRSELGIEHIQLAHASLVWFEALPNTPFEGSSFFGTDFRCAWFRTKTGIPLSFRGTDFRSANLECAWFDDKADTAGVQWKGTICPDGTKVSNEDDPRAGATTACEGHLKRPASCTAKCDDPAFTQAPPFQCPSRAASWNARAGNATTERAD